jgi:hypothetical protein
MLCNLPTRRGRIWADCGTKAFALAVAITTSYRSDPVRLADAYALQAAKLAQDIAEYVPAGQTA